MFWEIVLAGIALFALYMLFGIVVALAEGNDQRVMWITVAAIIVVAVVVYAVGWSGPRPYVLNRLSAEQAIRKQPNFDLGTQAYFTTGRQITWREPGATVSLERLTVPGSDQPFLETDQSNPTAKCFPTAGERAPAKVPELVSCYYNWPSIAAEEFFKRLEITQRLSAVEWRNPNDRKSEVKSYVYYAKVGDPVIAVTGIAEEGNHATVEFDLGFTNLDELGKLLMPGPPEKYSSKAEFTRYDDGWRITKLGEQLWVFGEERK